METRSFFLIPRHVVSSGHFSLLLMLAFLTFLAEFLIHRIWLLGTPDFMSPAVLWFVILCLTLLSSNSNSQSVEVRFSDRCTIKQGGYVLWVKDLKDIISIEIESTRSWLSVARRYLLIKCQDGDSFTLSLDHVRFLDQQDEQDITQTVSMPQ